MAFSSTGVLIVRPSGIDANGGGFNPGNSNMVADLATDANTANTNSPVVSSASYNFVAGDVGARVFVKAATVWLSGWYTIVSVAANKATLTASVGNATIYNGTYASGTNTVYNVNNFISGGANYAQGCSKDNTATATGGSWSIDYSNQDTARFAITDMVVGVTTTQFTSATTATFVGKHMIGNYINVVTQVSGTITLQRVEVVSTSGTVPAAGDIATCDKSLGTAASVGTGNLGGALLSPGMAGRLESSAPGALVANNHVYIKSGTYTLGSSTANIATGKVDATLAGSASSPNRWEGFGTVPKDGGTAPTIINAAFTGISIFKGTGGFTTIENINVDGNSQATTKGFEVTGARINLVKCKAQNCTTSGFDISAGGNQGLVARCTATLCSGTAGFLGGTGSVFANCEAYANTTAGFSLGNSCVANFCISSTNSGASSDGFLTTGIQAVLSNCTSYNNGRHGFNSSTSPQLFQNCLAEANSGYGYTATAGVNATTILLNCGAYNNTSGPINTTQLTLPAISFVANTTGSFFTNAAAGNFSLNATANQGALARAAGFPGLMPRGTSTGYTDIGAIQHQDPVGGGSVMGKHTTYQDGSQVRSW